MSGAEQVFLNIVSSTINQAVLQDDVMTEYKLSYRYDMQDKLAQILDTH